MKFFFSLLLWIFGSLFFLLSFCILFFSLLIFPQKITYRIARFLFGCLIRIMGIRLVVTGLENIRQGQSYLIMGNHQSLFDVFVIPAAIPLCFVGVEAAYHFSYPLWGYLIRKWGCIPIDRNNLEKAMLSLELAKKTLLAGMSIGVLPEGHRTRTGIIAPFKKGPFHLAKTAGTDILPFGIKGLFKYNRKGSFILNPGVVAVNIGKPVPYDVIKTLSVEEIRQSLFDIIYRLSKK